MPDLPRVSPLRYGVLAILFAIAFLFQAAISLHEVSSFWVDARHFDPDMLRSWAIALNLHILTPIACLILGFYVAAARPFDPKAWLLLAVLVSFSLVSCGSDIHDHVMTWHTPLKHAALVYRSAGLNSWPIFMVLFAIYFPDRAAFDRKQPWLKWIVLAPALALWVLAVGSHIANNEHIPALETFRRVADGTGWLRAGAFYILLAISLALFSWKRAATEDPDDRRRLRVLLVGLAVSFVPAIVLEAIGHHMMGMRRYPAWLSLPTYLAFILFPITLAYVTVVQRAMDVRVILRHSLQYALARRGLVIIQALVSLTVILLVAFFAGRIRFLGRAGLTAAGIGVVLFIGFVGRKLADMIDRRFFREAYDREQVLARLADSVGSIVELPALLTTVTGRVAEALHISEVAVFLGEQNFYRLAYALGYAQPPPIDFPDQSGTVRELQRDKKPLLVYPEDPRSWAAKLDDLEQRELNLLRAQLLLPLARREELLGFVSLGPRYSEAPYSPNDMDLLNSVAQQTALAVENSRLTSTVAAETAQREVIQRELSIARDVQQRLLPQTFPHREGLECFGFSRPAREVGGDYFDFLELAGGSLGLAIGDISGKGIPAALLMASLQAFLRGQTLSRIGSLETLMENVNRLVYAASSSNRYATFFYSQYDPASHSLTYVNAGHNAPIVLCKNGSGMSVQRLDKGGLPVGLLAQSEYQSACIELHPGDLVLLFTDGISEAMDMREEEWGEKRLIETLETLDGSVQPEAIVQKIFQKADEFAGGAPQHDDMTIVVLAVRR